ncbi:phage portal protein [Bradyrhizobium sp. BRP22]|uniref:phage portal protein n=1 Tax=Bradyrhizobium sp. BRP22 TaxID=2793821 RepID=UPI001CD7A52A|nr:phage portal protein [Bradyrhizobium sp. BRP22]MCA1452848.1 phage portal protein [Bradyrhizobium sp. BRP22]
MGALRDMLSEGALGKFISRTGKAARNDFDGGRNRRRLKSWQPTQNTTNAIMASQGPLLRARCRDALRNNAHANAACESFTANLIGTGIKPSSLLTDQPDLRAAMMQLWLDWTDQCDADGIADFYGLQTIVARALFEAGECFIRFRPRNVSDGFLVPLQVQLLESEMCPYWLNQFAANGNYIMNGIELDYRGRRTAYYFFPTHPGDAAVEPVPQLEPVRVPASEVLHIFKCTRPGQMRGVPLVTPALIRMFFLDQYDDAELERKRIAAMFAGFITTATPEDVVPIDGIDSSAPQENIALSGLEPGTMQTLLPGEDIKFSEPADVGGAYEAYQYRQQLALFGALGIPYSVCTSDLRRANYSSLRGSIVEYRRKLEQFQHNVIVFQMCTPIWRRWMDTAVLAQALPINETDYLLNQPTYQRAKWIPQRNDWVDPLKDRQAEKLAVDAGFKSRSDVIEAEGSDPEENDQRIAADHAREERLNLVFAVHTAAANQPLTPEEQAAKDAADQEAADQAAQDAADRAAAEDGG